MSDKNMGTTVHSFTKSLRSTKKTILLISIVVVITIIISTFISLWLERTFHLHVPSFGTINTLDVEAYWDIKLENKTEKIDWGTIWLGSSQNATFYLRSISNVKTNIYIHATNWKPDKFSDYMNLSWNYNGTAVHPDEVIQVTLTLSASSSRSFIIYLINNEVTEFSFDIIIIGTPEG